jgi:aldehyde:ferredoxin oxidoreductase
VASIEYETLGMCDSNLGIGDPDAVARLNRLCNELGLDIIEMGATLDVAAEAALLAFGDAERAIALVGEIGQGTVLGQGCYIAGRTSGVRRIPHLKRRAISTYDLGAAKGTGVTYATSPMAGDHTTGLTLSASVDHHRRAGLTATTDRLPDFFWPRMGRCGIYRPRSWTRSGKLVNFVNRSAHPF